MTAEMTILQKLHVEMEELAVRHGRADHHADSTYYHTTRANNSLDDVLLYDAANRDKIADRCIHLAAVCLRFAEAINGEGA